ncbi:hypothetical protein PFISCL1PPCAC_20036, partial [Pristionchus fissidentatus]
GMVLVSTPQLPLIVSSDDSPRCSLLDVPATCPSILQLIRPSSPLHIPAVHVPGITTSTLTTRRRLVEIMSVSERSRSLTAGVGLKRKLDDVKPLCARSKPGTITLIDPKYSKYFSTGDTVKKKRMIPFESILPQKRDVIDLLDEALNLISRGDGQLCRMNLRELSTDHLSTLDQRHHTKALQILIEIGRVSRIAEVGKLALRIVHSILERTDDDTLVDLLPHFVCVSETTERSLGTHHFLDASILSIMEMVFRRGVIDELDVVPPWILRVLERSEKDPHDPMKRREAVRFRVAIGVMNIVGGESPLDLQSILCECTRDRDVRVRMQAIEGIREVNQLQVDTYPVIKELCRDSQSSVRISSLKLIHRFAQTFPTHEISVSSSSSSLISSRISLSDDAFCIVCHAVNDMEVEVRSLACALLGEFDIVSESFLDQTLDKKLMKMKTTDGGSMIGVRTKDSLFSIRKVEKKRQEWSEWASGKELNEVARGEKKKRAKDEESIMPQGACGAFISALEDEFMCVRKAAVYSLGKLASTRPAFAATALDHLADMFNDEIEEVRLDSIKALAPLVSRGELYKEQLETIIKCLDDATPVSRSALRKLLEKAKFGDVECIRICVRSLLFCMKRYPMDKYEIFETMASLGRCHSSLVHPLVTQLLQIHPIFVSQEKSLQDDQYMAKLLLVLNAASQFEPIVSLLPPYAIRHFRYMRCAMPHLVPLVTAMEGHEREAAEKSLSLLRDESITSKGNVLQEVYSRLLDVQSTKELNTRTKLRKYIVEDLNAISSLNASLASPSRLLISLISILDSIDQTVLQSIGDAVEVHNDIDKELWTVECIEDGLASLPPPIQSFLVEIRLHQLVYRWLTSLLLRPLTYRIVVDNMRSEIIAIKRRLSSLSLVQSSSSNEVINGLDYLLQSGKIISTQVLTDLILKNPPSLPSSINNIESVRVKWAKIIEPESDISMERPHRFVAILPSCTSFVADVHELEEGDSERIRVKIDYPDGSVTLFRPRIKEMSKMDENTIRIRSNVLIAVSSAWSNAADVVLSVVLVPSSLSSRPIPLSSSPSS